ncbi:MAG: glycoside hydrolase domain-containing protein [Coprobacillaceae bacterium]
MGRRLFINSQKYSSRLKPSSATVGFAYNDYSVATMAKGLGKQADYEKYIASSKNWLNNWDESLTADGYSGFIHKRAEDGSYAVVNPSKSIGKDGTEMLWEGYNNDFYEAGIWEGSYSPTFDLPTLVEKMGGKYEYADRLNFALENEYLNFANEPSFQTIWTLASDEVQRPDLASHWVRDYLDMYTDVGYPDDEDNGAMSSMYMFMMSGFFPMSGTNNYYLHGTYLPKVTYHLGTGNDFIIKGINTGEDNIYVQSATWNGKPLTSSKLTWEQMSQGGTLEYVMGNEPSDWARVTDTEKPSDVGNLLIDDSQIGEGRLSLSWDKASDNTQIKSYNIYASTEENYPLDETTLITSTKETTYSFDVSNDVKYYRVEAVDYFGNKSDNPPTIKAEYSDTEKPVFTDAITLDKRYLEVGQFRLDWEKATDNTKVKEYRIYKGTEADFKMNDDTFMESTTELTYSTFKKAGTYYYKVCAVDVFGNTSDALSIKVESEKGLEGLPLDATTNIAKGMDATASGQTNNNESAAKAVDGSTDTKWCCKDIQSSDTNGFWLEIDLKDTYQINRWVVKHASASKAEASKPEYNTKDFKLQVKSDDEWLDIDTVSDNEAGTTDRKVPMFEGRYIRVYISEPTRAGQARTVRLYEFELYGDQNDLLFEDSLMRNPNITATVNNQASTSEGAYEAFDFNSSTKWSCRYQAATDGYYWLEVTLPNLYKINSMELLGAGNENPDYVTKNFSLQVKENDQWKDVLTVTDNTENLYQGGISEEAIGRQFRLLIPKLADGGWANARILEFHLYGERMVDKAALDTLITEVKALSEKDYTPKSWKGLATPLNDAETVFNNSNASQEEVDNAITALQTAKDVLVERADKTALDTLITEVKALSEKDYTPKSWKGLTTPLSDAEAVSKNNNVSQEDVNNAITTLQTAKDALVERADKIALDALITEVKALSEEDYTPKSWKVLATPLCDSEAVSKNNNASQEEVNEAATVLQAAKDALVEKTVGLEVEKTKLEEAIKKAKALDKTLYTETSWKQLSDTLVNAETIYNDVDASQEQVDQIVKALNEAIESLQKIEVNIKGTTTSTGDTTNTIGYFVLCAISVRVVYYGLRKRKKS